MDTVPNTQQQQQQQHGNIFIYKGMRDCKSAPARTLPRPNSSISVSISSSSFISSSPSPSSTNRKNKKESSQTSSSSCMPPTCWRRKLLNFLFGHAPQFTTWATTSYSSSTTTTCTSSRTRYLSLFFVESLFRSIGSVTFCSNPLSGLLIFVGMLVSCPRVAFLGGLAVAFGVGTAVGFVGVPVGEVRSGGVLFNNFLAGSVVGLLRRDDDDGGGGGGVLLLKDEAVFIIPVCIVVGVFTVIIWRGLNGFLSSRCEFPLLNAPFHIMLLLYIFSGVADQFKRVHVDDDELKPLQYSSVLTEDLLLRNSSTTTGNNGTNPLHQKATIIDFEKIIHGVFLAPSQVFGTNTTMTSGLVYIAIFVYSPIMGLQALCGAGVGTITGIFLSKPDDYNALYDGSWGYNSLFTSAALGGFFLVFNLYSWGLAIVGGVIAALGYSAMVKLSIPPLGIPFMLTTWLLLPNNNSIGHANDDNNTDTYDDDDDNSPPPPPHHHPNQIFKKVYVRLRLSGITTPEGNLLRWMKRNDNDDEHRGSSNNEKYSAEEKLQHNSVLPL